MGLSQGENLCYKEESGGGGSILPNSNINHGRGGFLSLVVVVMMLNGWQRQRQSTTTPSFPLCVCFFIHINGFARDWGRGGFDTAFVNVNKRRGQCPFELKLILTPCCKKTAAAAHIEYDNNLIWHTRAAAAERQQHNEKDNNWNHRTAQSPLVFVAKWLISSPLLQHKLIPAIMSLPFEKSPWRSWFFSKLFDDVWCGIHLDSNPIPLLGQTQKEPGKWKKPWPYRGVDNGHKDMFEWFGCQFCTQRYHCTCHGAGKCFYYSMWCNFVRGE